MRGKVTKRTVDGLVVPGGADEATLSGYGDQGIRYSRPCKWHKDLHTALSRRLWPRGTPAQSHHRQARVALDA